MEAGSLQDIVEAVRSADDWLADMQTRVQRGDLDAEVFCLRLADARYWLADAERKLAGTDAWTPSAR